jgi:hypothetical protein
MRGPLDDERLGWIVDLYGPVDSKYRSLEYVRHQFVDNPFGWSAHVFAHDGMRAVGHSGAVPFRARYGADAIVAGKIEAVTVDQAYRGRREGDGGSVATDILSALYPFGLENGMDVLFGLAPEGVARVHARAGCRLIPLDAPAYTMVVDAGAWGAHERSGRRRRAAAGLGQAQRILVASHGPPPPADVRAPTAADEDLAAAADVAGRWTIHGIDAWDWFAGSGVLKVLEVPGRNGSRALVRLVDEEGALVQIVAWLPRRPGIRPAVTLLRVAARIARQRGAPTLRFQPWKGDAPEATLGRACALLGFVRRPEADLVLFASDARYDSVHLTPFFYVTF